MDNYSTDSTLSISAESTPRHVYSPIPIRTPQILAFSFKFTTEALTKLDSEHNSSEKLDSAKNPNKLIYRKFLDLAKEDLEKEPKYDHIFRTRILI